MPLKEEPMQFLGHAELPKLDPGEVPIAVCYCTINVAEARAAVKTAEAQAALKADPLNLPQVEFKTRVGMPQDIQDNLTTARDVLKAMAVAIEARRKELGLL